MNKKSLSSAIAKLHKLHKKHKAKRHAGSTGLCKRPGCCAAADVRPFRAGALQCMLGRRPAPAAGHRAPARCRAALAKALTEESELTEVPEPEDARGAIAVGLKLYNAGQHSAALDMFVKALELPGTGLKRFRSGNLLSMFLKC